MPCAAPARSGRSPSCLGVGWCAGGRMYTRGGAACEGGGVEDWMGGWPEMRAKNRASDSREIFPVQSAPDGRSRRDACITALDVGNWLPENYRMGDYVIADGYIAT